jgi:hypothetical protein
MPLQAKEYHVSPKGNDMNDGSPSKPLRTINRAAQCALPGDTVTVHAGTYREWVNPLYGGESNYRRILYRAAEGEEVYLKGSELVKGWRKEKKGDGVWKVVLPNSFFGSYNPYVVRLSGDWFDPMRHTHLTGDVYLNDVSLYEVDDLNQVYAPTAIKSVRDPQGTTAVWYATVDGKSTTIYARFGKCDPNKETVEIAARPTCFYPTQQGLNYITIRGFHVSQAATQWAAPTAEQIGMIATHWCKGWIIEDNVIKNSRCNGISLGKERSSGHNLWLTDKRLDGTAHYLEVIFRVLRNGWDRSTVGSHIVRHNIISDCEQTAICGSMGGAFSEIYGNHIYNIWCKRQFSGAEMAGIKLHGSIDVYIHNNCIHGCGRGIWLDWMNQGSRVSSNLMYNNTDQDLFCEVDHGPYLVDNNIFLSTRFHEECSDGGAYVHNIIAGDISRHDESRYTPYHLAHSTQIKGISTITNGDHRYYNNLFLGGDDGQKEYGLCVYNSAHGPIYAAGNLFCHGARGLKDNHQDVEAKDINPAVRLDEKADGIYLTIKMNPQQLSDVKTRYVTTDLLGTTRLSGYCYEQSNGDKIVIDKDYLGNSRPTESPTVGPLESLRGKSELTVKVWNFER